MLIRHVRFRPEPDLATRGRLNVCLIIKQTFTALVASIKSYLDLDQARH